MKLLDTKPRRGLVFEFVALLSVIVLIGYAVIIYTQYQSQSAAIEQNLNDRARSLGGLLSTISIEPLLSSDYVGLNEYIEGAVSQKDVAFVVITGIKGESLAVQVDEKQEAIRESIRSRAEQSGLGSFVAVVNDEIFPYEYPIIFNGEKIATITLGLDRQSAHQIMLENMAKLSIVIFAVWFVAGLSIYLIFRFRVSDPLGSVATSATNVARLNFDKTVPVAGANEIRQLALTFNEMRMHLKDAIEARNKSMHKLKELNLNLEERVDQRTRELETLNREVAYQAVHDPLTGLPNRLLIVERIRYAIKQAHRNQSSFATLMVDLDNFKEVNDTLGHPVGDELLRQVAERLQAVLRETDTVGRLGGDEFALVLQELEMESAEIVADKIHNAMLESFKVENHTLVAGGSIGIAVYPDHGDDYATLLRCADVAMYNAKRNNTKVAMYSPDIDPHSLQRLALATDLRTACHNNELELLYQPIIDLKTGKVVSVEALARWNHPKYGVIPPSEFISIAENSNLIKPLTEWVVRTAAAQWVEWHEQDLELQIAVNFSMISLLDPELPLFMANMSEELSLPKHALKLEITESAIMSNPERVIKVLNHKEMAGLKYSVDDFGTGYSSLSYLKRLPVQEVKIDRSFVTLMTVDEEDASIVRAVVELAHSLGLATVAEGVEDADVLRELVSLGCEYAQGYYFSKPIRPDELTGAISHIETRFYDTVSIAADFEASVKH